jgi:hypothetical protein
MVGKMWEEVVTTYLRYLLFLLFSMNEHIKDCKTLLKFVNAKINDLDVLTPIPGSQGCDH